MSGVGSGPGVAGDGRDLPTPTNLRAHPGTALQRPVTVALIGAGARGAAYGDLVDRVSIPGRVVAVAEPRHDVRAAAAARHGIPPERTFTTWQEMVAHARLADLAIVATQDHDHVAPAVALAGQGYDLLLEKPLAPDESGVTAILEAVQRAGVTAAVCHVLRYTPHTAAVRALLADGVIGTLMSIQHLEPIGWYHFAHSFVRGNWRREDQSSPLLLAKSVHDLDWLCDVVNRRIQRVSSFGSLTHFRAESAPDGAGDRCIDCDIEPDCPYSATRLYRLGAQWTQEQRNGDPGGSSASPAAPANLVTEVAPSTAAYFARVAVGGVEPTAELVEQALAHGPYGRCVYACDNDVVDHQVVAMEFEGGVTVDFQLTAFTPLEGRRTRLFGSHGQIVSDGRRLTVTDFRTGRTSVQDSSAAAASADAGHGGGDFGLVDGLLRALSLGDPVTIRSQLRDSVVSHRIAFAAERARLAGTVESIVAA